MIYISIIRRKYKSFFECSQISELSCLPCFNGVINSLLQSAKCQSLQAFVHILMSKVNYREMKGVYIGVAKVLILLTVCWLESDIE